MKAYLLTTGTVFVLIIVAHIARMFAEGPGLLKEPAYVLTTVLCTALVVWAWRLLPRSPRA